MLEGGLGVLKSPPRQNILLKMISNMMKHDTKARTKQINIKKHVKEVNRADM